MKTWNNGLLCTAASLLATLAAAHAWAGDLNPPGAPGSTMISLERVEPRTPIESLPGDAVALHIISQPGTYYLTGSVLGQAGKSGISVRASDVTIDLMGFTLQGVAGSLRGVDVPAPVTNLRVRNGVVRSWGSVGVSAGNANQSVAEDLTLWSNGGDGVFLGVNARITACIARQNGGSGAGLLALGVIEYVTTVGNTGAGILATGGATVFGCTAEGNQGGGIVLTSAFLPIDSSIAEACSARSNTGDGFRLGAGATLRGSSAVANSGDGVEGASASLIESVATAGNAQFGIRAGVLSQVTGSTAWDNDQTGIDAGSVTSSAAGRNGSFGIAATSVVGSAAWNNAVGISAGPGGAVRECSSTENLQEGYLLLDSAVSHSIAAQNGTIGFNAQTSTRLFECVAAHNGSDGMRLSDGSEARRSLLHSNTQHGVNVLGAKVLVDQNHFAVNGGFGLLLSGTSSGCTATRNSFFGLGELSNVGASNSVATLSSTPSTAAPYANIEW